MPVPVAALPAQPVPAALKRAGASAHAASQGGAGAAATWSPRRCFGLSPFDVPAVSPRSAAAAPTRPGDQLMPPVTLTALLHRTGQSRDRAERAQSQPRMERCRRTPAGLATALLPHRWGRGWAVSGELGAQPSLVLLGCCPPRKRRHGDAGMALAPEELPPPESGCCQTWAVPSCESQGCADGHSTAQGSELRVRGGGSASPPTESGGITPGAGRAASGHGTDPGPTCGRWGLGCARGELGLSITAGRERKVGHP